MSDHAQYLPRMLPNVPIITKIACGYTHTTAIDIQGLLWVWGSGSRGKLGSGSTETFYEPTNIQLDTFNPKPTDPLVKLACGEDHTVVVSSNGDVFSAGIAKYSGHRRDNQNMNILRFTLITEIEQPISKIAVGKNHSIALSNSGVLYGWGDMAYSKMGMIYSNIDPEDRTICYPTMLNTQSALVLHASCGPNHTAFISSDGQLFLLGLTLKGRLGVGDLVSKNGERITQVEIPMNISGVHKWLLANKKRLKKEVATISLQDEKYELQALIENENYASKHEALLADLIKLKQ
jgi:alpha-tubulin suppressor-like RCC1 family protein